MPDAHALLAPRRTLIDVIVPARGLAVQIALVLAASALVALSARLSFHLPWSPVPVTGQTYAILLIGALLGSRRGALALLAYLGEGLAGLPVFAGGTSAWSPSIVGVPVIVGPTAGYLFAFPFAALAVGFLAERGWDRTLWRAALAMLCGEAIIYAGALPWLAHFVGANHVLQAGLLPFIPGDTIKIVLAAATLPTGWKVLRSIGA